MSYPEESLLDKIMRKKGGVKLAYFKYPCS